MLREERRLRVFGNGVLGKIFGTKRDEVTGEWRRLHNEEFCDLYFTSNNIWVMKLSGACGTDVGQERCIRSFGGEIRRNENSWKT